jgi:predicted phage terminase large subunit-like protein
MALTQKDFEKQYADVMQRIQKQATPFPNDSTAKREARKKRAKADRFFFACTYFPHYIVVSEALRTCWKDPNGTYDWIHEGFAPFHADFWKYTEALNQLFIVAGFRESAKDTLLGLVDPIHKLVCEDRWFIPIIAKTEVKAETKCVPIKLELEMNERLKSDFGDLRGTVEWEFGSFITRTRRKVKGYGREQALRGEVNFGHRPDHVILNDIDDPTKPDSPGQVMKFTNSIREDIRYAVNSPRWSALFLCNWTIKGNIVDEMITGKNTSHFSKHIIRALIPNELETKSDLQIAKQCRDAGFPDTMKSAWEFRHPTVGLLQEQKDDPDSFDTERMMHPRNRKDQRFKDNWFRFHTKEDLAKRTYVHYTFVDSSAKEAADYKAVVTVGLGLNAAGEVHIPVRRASIQQQSIDEMMVETYRQKKAFNSKLVGVETNGFQILLKREYLRLQKKYGLLPFKEVVHAGESKESRIERIAPFVKEGTITFDQTDPDQELLMRQLKAFPSAGQVAAGGLGDDGPDALAGCVELIEKFPNAGAVEYTSLKKREAVFDRGSW